MKKFIALLMVLSMVLAFAGCAATDIKDNDSTPAQTTEPTGTTGSNNDGGDNNDGGEDDTVMTHDEYVAAELDTQVVVDTYVQATQSWWDNTITVYAQGEDGAYFIYNMACSEEDAAKLVAGTAIRVTGYKGEWAGEIEIMDATFEFIDSDPVVISAIDMTDLLGTEEIINHQNELAAFTGMTVESIDYKNGEPGDDIYLTLSKDGVNYSFCVEVYLTGTDSDVYTTVGTLNVGDVVNVEGFLYWYDGMNPHVTSIALAE